MPSLLQQPSMRQARWQVADAICAICTSFRNSASAAAGAPAVRKDLTATCSSSQVKSRTVACRRQRLLLVPIPESFSALAAGLLDTGWCRLRLELGQLPVSGMQVRCCIRSCWSLSWTVIVTQGGSKSRLQRRAFTGKITFIEIGFTIEHSADPGCEQ